MNGSGSKRQSGKPLVSVIMNCLNSEKYLREAIDSAYAQSYANWELIFWDNASTDNSPVIAQSYGDGRLRYFRGETTVPLGRARNLAIAESSGELIAFLDCDDLWFPEKLAKQVPLFVADSEVGLVYSDTYFFNDRGLQQRLYRKRKPYRGRCFRELLNNYLISLETAVVRRAALDSLDHWFDVNFNMIEECDLFVRIGLNWKIDFSRDVLAKWRVHGDSWTWKAPDSFVAERRTMLEKLQAMPEVKRAYSADLESAWLGQSLAEARLHWKHGDGQSARRIVRRSGARGLTAYVYWLASFLPYSLVESAYRCMIQSVTPASAS